MHRLVLVLASVVCATHRGRAQIPGEQRQGNVHGVRRHEWKLVDSDAEAARPHPACQSALCRLKALATFLLAWSSPSAGWHVLNPSPLNYRAVLQPIRHKFMKASKQLVQEPLTEEQLREAHMATVQQSVIKAAPSILSQLGSRGFAVIDDFLPKSTISSMRSEAESLYLGGHLKPSETDKWIESEGRMGVFEKKNILYCALKGGADYFNSPRMHEYMAFLGKSLVPLVNAEFAHARLQFALENKLAVCLGDGSKYDKHFDVGGPNDVRKLTVLLYMNPGYEESQGGCFRVFTNGAKLDRKDITPGVAAGLDEEGNTFVDIFPLGGRLLVFWADTTVHSVTEYSATPENPRRWALTVWIGAEDATALRFEKEIATRHFAPSIVEWLDVHHVGTKL